MFLSTMERETASRISARQFYFIFFLVCLMRLIRCFLMSFICRPAASHVIGVRA